MFKCCCGYIYKGISRSSRLWIDLRLPLPDLSLYHQFFGCLAFKLTIFVLLSLHDHISQWCVYIWVCVCLCCEFGCECVYMCGHVCLYVWVWVCLHVGLFICVCVCVWGWGTCLFLCVCVCVVLCVFVCIYLYVYICVYMYVRGCLCVCMFLCKCGFVYACMCMFVCVFDGRFMGKTRLVYTKAEDTNFDTNLTNLDFVSY